jgi:serine/threonine-protein kinase PknG
VARCDHPDCGRGDVDDQGFCPVCHREPLRAPEPARPPGPVADRPGPAPEAGRESEARPEPWWGLSLIEPGAVPVSADGPMEAGPVVPEEQRFCPNGHPVGRGRPQGFCAKCGERFDFTRPRPFQTIAGRYEVYRKLGAGSFGAALLAYDRNLDTDVVLKDLTRSVARTARQERNALVGLRHDSIVRIYGYEPKGPYLVLEYVRGTPLSVRADDRIEVILGHGLQILQALDYLHARGLLHMDVKPENIIRFGEQGADGPRDRVRLIDFGAVRELGSAGLVGSYTEAYAPPKTDSEHQHPTVRFDLFCLATTLQMLCRRHLREPAAPGVAALDALLKRAADIRTPERRFVSARQFAEQLSGVIRQVVAASPGGRRVTRPSAIFGAMTEPLHGGLAGPRPLGHWIEARMSADRGLTMAAPFAAPAPADVVAALPAPLADPDDPALPQSREASLVACRAALRRGELNAADRSLTETRLPAWSWVRAWYSGLIALARGNAPAAAGDFGIVRDALPGELIPLLALGLCAEISGDRTRARRCYQTVAGTAPAFGAASFGLARMLLLDGQRAEAVATAERLAGELQAGELRFEQAARIAVVRLLAAVTDSRVPTERDLARAQEVTDGLRVNGDLKIGLDAEIQYGRSRVTGDWLALSERIRRLASLAGTQPDFFAMTDLANRLRPPVTWWWQHRSHRIRDRSTTSRIS